MDNLLQNNQGHANNSDSESAYDNTNTIESMVDSGVDTTERKYY